MNFIAHIHLSGADDQRLVGNYISDLIRQSDVALLPDGIRAGVKLHRYIDTFTDQHEINKSALEYLYPHHRKYAPVLLDIFYDYFLIKNWSDFSSEPFADTCARTYNALEKYFDDIPASAQSNIQNLLNKRWLETAYGSIEGLEKTFHFLGMRMSKPELIAGATATMTTYESELEDAFLSFYPELLLAISEFRF